MTAPCSLPRKAGNGRGGRMRAAAGGSVPLGIVVAVLVAAIGWVAAEVGDTRGELLAAIQANADRIDANRDRIDALNQRFGETNERLARTETLLGERLPERR